MGGLTQKEETQALPALRPQCCSGARSTKRYRAEGGPVMCEKHFLAENLLKCSAASCNYTATVFCVEDGSEFCCLHGRQHVRRMAERGVRCGE